MKRLYFLWAYAVILTAFLAASILTMVEERRMLNDATSRLSALSAGIEENVILNYNETKNNRIAKSAEKLVQSKKILGIAICDPMTSKHFSYPNQTEYENLCSSFRIRRFINQSTNTDETWTLSNIDSKIQYYFHPIDLGPKNSKLYLILIQNISFIRTAWVESFIRIFISTSLVSILLIFLVTTQVTQWIKENFKFLQQSLRAITAGKKPLPLPPSIDEPISKEINSIATQLLSLQPSSKRSDLAWLRSLQKEMHNQKLIVIANREPYIHQKKNDQIEVVRPASGLVTALEPVLRQFGGLWIAHGSGSGDRETVDSKNEVRVPPLNPTYTLKRVWLTQEEELGYYYGFSNEGMWPLCHLAHNRPIFRLSDWESYKAVNLKFAESIPSNHLDDHSITLVQDYHFALLPRLIRSRMPSRKNKIGLFWHIPWPNPEAFGICPWNEELLKGMLGSDIIGFHTQYHCNNFLETCNRYLEARINWENFSVTMDSHETRIRAFPIGIDTAPVKTLSDQEVLDLKRKYGITAEIVAVGVDRIDYTKGLVERVESVERLLEKHPEYIGKFSLVQMGSPSRTHIPAYQALSQQLEKAVDRVNTKYGNLSGNPNYRPIIFLNEHHEWEEIQYFYQIGDICMVTSLHDGMNLVAKEYVWCQKPERGSLILSKFTGASRELVEAFIINPYSTEELADAIVGAIRLPVEEKSRRMNAMKEKIHAHNAFHWASDLIRALLMKEEISSPQPVKLDPQDRFLSASGF